MKFDIIESSLSQFDLNSRDEYNNIPESSRMDQLIKNLINDKTLDAYNYNNYLEYAIKINELMYDLDEVPGYEDKYDPQPYEAILKKPEINPQKYVDAFFDEEIIEKWDKNNSVFILAGTGRGKNTFIRNQIIPLQSHEKIIMFVNRSTLFKQQKILMDNRVTKTEDDIIGEFVANGIVNITENLLLVSYRRN